MTRFSWRAADSASVLDLSVSKVNVFATITLEHRRILPNGFSVGSCPRIGFPDRQFRLAVLSAICVRLVNGPRCRLLLLFERNGGDVDDHHRKFSATSRVYPDLPNREAPQWQRRRPPWLPGIA